MSRSRCCRVRRFQRRIFLGNLRLIPIAPSRMDSSKGPPRKIGKIFGFSGPRKKWPGMAPNGAGGFFFRLKKILPTFWAERILMLRICVFWIFLGPKFLAWPTWAHLGPPTWAQLGPGVGPPTWARRGPTHLGPAWAHPRGPSLGPPTWAHPLGPSVGPRGSVSYTHLTLPTICSV